MATIDTSYLFTENGTGVYSLFGHGGGSYDIVFPEAIENVTAIDVTQMTSSDGSPITVRNTTMSFSGSFQIYVKDESDATVGFGSTSLSALQSKNMSTIGIIDVGGATVKTISFQAQHGTGANVTTDGTLDSTSTFIVTSLAPDPLDITVGPIYALSSWPEILNATSYRLDLTDGSFTKTVIENTVDLEYVVRGLVPETEYIFSLYSSEDDVLYTFVASVTLTTLANVSSNYDLSFAYSGGKYDTSGLGVEYLDAVLKDIFITGDIMTIESLGKTGEILRDGGNVNVNTNAVILAFDSTGGSGESATITLPDLTISSIEVFDSADEIVFNGTTYSIGNVFVVGDYKVTVRTLT